MMTSVQDVDALLGQLRVDVDNLNVDITQNWFPRSKKTEKDRAFVNAWVRWRNEAYKLVSGWRKGFRIQLAWNYWNRGEEKQRELVKWRETFQKLTGETPTAPSAAPPPDSKKASPWMYAAIAGLGAIGFAWITRKKD